MFTNDEVEWLAQDRSYCIPCDKTRYGCPKKKPKDCPLIPDYKDAAEFEAIVQKYLLKEPGNDEPPCWYGQHKPEPLCVVECDSPWLTCKEQRLKWARLKAEEEMDAHH